jgi:Ca-activated chloride channel family protein
MTAIMFEFSRPLTLALIPTLFIWWAWRFGNRTEAVNFRLSGEAGRVGLLSHLPPSYRTLRLLTMTVLILALAGPQVREVRTLAPEEGLALVVALDLSGSMGMTLPGGGSRLDGARDELTRFVRARPHDRIGLVTFGEDALTRVPPTTDHEHMLGVLETVRVTDADEGTAIGMGLGLAAHAVLQVPNPSRVVLLMTDGRSNTGTLGPLSAAEAAGRLGVRIHAIGVGPVTGDDPLDEALLQAVVEEGNGRFFRAADSDGLRAVLSELDELEKGPIAERAGFTFESKHHGLVLVAMLLFVLEAALRANPRGRLT